MKRAIAGASCAVLVAGVGAMMLQGGSASAVEYSYYQRSTTATVSSGAFQSFSKTCDLTSDIVVGGGAEVIDETTGTPAPGTYMRMVSSVPFVETNNKPGWRASFYNSGSSATITLKVFAICATPA